jgi:hypothetical protein
MRLTKRKPRQYGSIQECSITEMEKIEYRQTGMIKVKEPLSVGCKSHYEIIRERAYYDVVETPLFKLLDELCE